MKDNWNGWGGSTYDASLEIGATSFLGSLNDLFGDDSAVRAGDLGFLELAGNTLADKMAQAQADLGHVDCRDG
jgi:hypothetical protein